MQGPTELAPQLNSWPLIAHSSRIYSCTPAPKIFNFLIVVLLFPTHSLSQDDVEEWDVTLARGKTRDISFETNEGTWMSVDISPGNHSVSIVDKNGNTDLVKFKAH